MRSERIVLSYPHRNFLSKFLKICLKHRNTSLNQTSIRIMILLYIIYNASSILLGNFYLSSFFVFFLYELNNLVDFKRKYWSSFRVFISEPYFISIFKLLSLEVHVTMHPQNTVTLKKNMTLFKILLYFMKAK